MISTWTLSDLLLRQERFLASACFKCSVDSGSINWISYQNYQNWGAKFPSTSMLGIFKSSSSEIFQFHVGMYLPSYNRHCTDIYLIVVHVQSYRVHVLFFHVVFFLKFMKIFSAPYVLIHNNKYEEAC